MEKSIPEVCENRPALESARGEAKPTKSTPAKPKLSDKTKGGTDPGKPAKPRTTAKPGKAKSTAKPKTSPTSAKRAKPEKTAKTTKPAKSPRRKADAKPGRQPSWLRPLKLELRVKTVLLAALGTIGIILCVTLGFHTRRLTSEEVFGAKVPPGNWRYGIDISHNNEGRIVWDSLFVMTDRQGRTIKDPYQAKEIKPVSFVFIKATEGGTFKDKDFKDNWRAAERAGIKRGAYHFFRSSKDGEVQARHFIKVVGKLSKGDLPPVLDIETIHKGCSKKLLNERALQWLKAVERHYGRKPVVYSGASFAKDYLCKEIREGYPVWIAHYKKDRPSYEGWTWWQFTDRALVHGIPGPVDLNVTAVQSKEE